MSTMAALGHVCVVVVVVDGCTVKGEWVIKW